jgi:cyclase
MFRPRVIPLLLLKDKGLVKSVKFKNYRYIGDPINAVKIFNDLKADELVFLDILASRENRSISLDFVKNVGEEANMPFAVGGGIKNIKDIREIIAAGAEKVIINTQAVNNPDFIKESSETFGSSTISICLDIKKNLFGKVKIWSNNGRKQSSYSPLEFAQLMEEKGAGELIVQSISNDGLMNGYDLETIQLVSKAVSIPVVAAGGAGSLDDFKMAHAQAYASAVTAGSMFVFHGPRRAVLINYPNSEDLKSIFN